MLEIKMVVAQCTTAELSATAAYLTALADGRSAVTSAREPVVAMIRGVGATAGQPLPAILGTAAGVAIVDEIAAGAKQPTEVGNMVVKLSVDNTQALAAIDEVKQAAAPLPASVTDKLVATIDPLDLPDAGVDTMQSTPNRLDAPDPAFAAFREQAVGKVAQEFSVPASALPNVVPSTAAAAPSTTAPAAPPATSTPVQNASLPPVPPVPAAAAQTAAPTNAVPVDKDGLPWDQRIHSESKAVNADKTWRKKRNVGPDKVAEIEAELRAVMGIAPAAAPTPAAKPEAAWPFPSRGPVPQAAVLPPIPAVTAAPAPPPPPDGEMDFADFMDAIVPLFNDDRLTMEQAKSICGTVQEGLTLSTLPNRPDLIPAVLKAIIAATPAS